MLRAKHSRHSPLNISWPEVTSGLSVWPRLPKPKTSGGTRNIWNLWAETCRENTASKQQPEAQIPISQPHPTPQNHHPLSQSDCPENCGSHKTLRLRSEVILHTSSSHASARFLAISHEPDTSCFHPKPSPKASANVSTIAQHCGRLQTVATCGKRLRTPRQRVANKSLPPDPQS